jgi:serine/threonine protein phosphatase PrpC
VEIRLLGREHEAVGEVETRTLAWGGVRVEAAISRGGPATGDKPNEDALLVIAPEAPGMPLIVAVADAHFGREAAELAVGAVAGVQGRTDWTPGDAGHLRETLLRMVRAAQAAVLEGGSPSETTLLIGLLAGRDFHWASVGDSYLYWFRPGRRPAVQTRADRVWLGARLAVPVQEVTRLGRCRLGGGDRVLLTTDGIPEAVWNVLTLTPRRIEELLAAGGDAALEGLARAAIDRAGEDNIAAVLLTGGP